MAVNGKKRRDAAGRFDQTAVYAPAEAVGLVKMLASASFVESADAAFTLGIDPRQADQAVRGTVSLPHGTGKDVKIVVFAEGDEARAAADAGADVIGGEDLAEAITAGAQPLDWDVTIAAPSLMATVGKLGRVLGPRGLMPNPKAGTVTPNVGSAVEEFKAGRLEYRNDRYGNVHVPFGKVSMAEENLVENLVAVVDELLRVRPSAAKGRYIQKLTVSSTMGHGVKIDTNQLEDFVNDTQ